MSIVNISPIENGENASPNLWNNRFSAITEVINGNIDASNIRTGSITRDKLSQDALSAAWPVGSVYISVNETNPATFFGGNWVKFGAGRALVGLDESDSHFDTLEKTGGSKMMQEHSHTGTTSAAGNHTHSYSVPVYQQLTHYGNYARVAWEGYQESGRTTSASGNHTHTFNTAAAGSGDAENLQPFLVVNFWKRIS